MSFADFGLAPPILRAVAHEGYEVPTPIQLQAIPHVVAGRDLLGCAQTGTGKTAAFALPILQRLIDLAAGHGGRGRTPKSLILSPTRELAAQIGDSFQAYGRHTGLKHCVVYGGVSQVNQVKQLRAGIDILIATPGRLLDLMNQGFIELGAVEIFVLDEADRMLDMGFLPDLKRIIAKVPKQRQTLFFSATMPSAIQHLADAILRDPAEVRIVPERATADLIEQSVCFISKENKTRLLTEYLQTPAVTRAIVFTRTKHGADRVTKQLNRAGINAAAIHGDKTQSARQKALAGFKSDRNGRQVLVATDVAARGIDVDAVSHVLNYDLPHEPEVYVHRIGRTGRAGAAGIAVSFCDRDERQHLQAIERLLRKKIPVENTLAKTMEKSDEGETRVPPSSEAMQSRQPAPRPQSHGGQTRRAKFGKSRPSPAPAATDSGNSTANTANQSRGEFVGNLPPKRRKRRPPTKSFAGRR